jgi:hypothetical protein
MLFKEKYFERFKHGIEKSLIAFSKNSAISIIVLRDMIENHFYQIDIGKFVNKIQQNLPSEDILIALEYDISAKTRGFVESHKCHLLSAYFYKFYFSRIPILFRCNRLIHKGRRIVPSLKEVNDIISLCAN